MRENSINSELVAGISAELTEFYVHFKIMDRIIAFPFREVKMCSAGLSNREQDAEWNQSVEFS